MPNCSKGFYADLDGDLDRFEKLRLEAISYKDNVANASSMLPVVELFMAAHMRSRNFSVGKTVDVRRFFLLASLTCVKVLAPRSRPCRGCRRRRDTLILGQKVAEHILHFLFFHFGVHDAARFAA